MPLNQAFGISEDDVATVLCANVAFLSSQNASAPGALAGKVFDQFDQANHDRVAAAALEATLTGDADDDLSAQTDQAHKEIRAILVEQGVLTH